MTFIEKIKLMLESRGMFPEQADKVIKLVVNAPENKAMHGRWHEQVDSYPNNFINILWISVKTQAIKYIDENCPEAWFRPMFR